MLVIFIEYIITVVFICNEINNVFQAIGARLEEMYIEDKQHVNDVVSMLADENKQKELLMEDEEEDFLDECNFLFTVFTLFIYFAKCFWDFSSSGLKRLGFLW